MKVISTNSNSFADVSVQKTSGQVSQLPDGLGSTAFFEKFLSEIDLTGDGGTVQGKSNNGATSDFTDAETQAPCSDMQNLQDEGSGSAITGAIFSSNVPISSQVFVLPVNNGEGLEVSLDTTQGFDRPSTSLLLTGSNLTSSFPEVLTNPSIKTSSSANQSVEKSVATSLPNLDYFLSDKLVQGLESKVNISESDILSSQMSVSDGALALAAGSGEQVFGGQVTLPQVSVSDDALVLAAGLLSATNSESLGQAMQRGSGELNIDGDPGVSTENYTGEAYIIADNGAQGPASPNDTIDKTIRDVLVSSHDVGNVLEINSTETLIDSGRFRAENSLIPLGGVSASLNQVDNFHSGSLSQIQEVRTILTAPHLARWDTAVVQLELFRLIRDGGGHVVMKLTPPDEGSFRISLELDPHLGVKVRVDGASDSVKTRLEQGSDQLKQQFTQMGLNLQLDMSGRRDARDHSMADFSRAKSPIDLDSRDIGVSTKATIDDTDVIVSRVASSFLTESVVYLKA